MVQIITHNDVLLGLIISHKFSEPGIHFFTPHHFPQQLGYMRHKEGKLIQPHLHNPVSHVIKQTQEVLFIRRGKMRVDFYDDEKNYFESHILEAGDVILLAAGGHGFEVLEEVEIIEVKQGPYAGEADKTRFIGVNAEEIKLRDNEESDEYVSACKPAFA